jgi:hypothetical protein
MYADSRYRTAQLAIPISSHFAIPRFAEIDPRPLAWRMRSASSLSSYRTSLTFQCAGRITLGGVPRIGR